VPESFLQLDRRERRQILTGVGSSLGRTPEVLEKDVWVCWVLNELFTMPNRKQMVFKGGTSLSKVYNAIKRFSEDVDVTIGPPAKVAACYPGQALNCQGRGHDL
jgi:predicted nucleotidyltransferase component of viral defense system